MQWRGRLYTRAAACPDTTLVSDPDPNGVCLGNIVCRVIYLEPAHDCGHTEVAPDPEFTRVQEEVCSKEKHC